MLNMKCELCEIGGKIELCDGTFIKLTPEMKLWTKNLNEKEYKQLMKDESEARIKKLEKFDKIWVTTKKVHPPQKLF